MSYINLSYKLIPCDFMAAAGGNPMNAGKSIGMCHLKWENLYSLAIMFILKKINSFHFFIYVCMQAFS